MINFMCMVFAIVGLCSPMIAIAEDVKIESTSAARQLHTRSLAASCAACHGTNGNSVGDTAKLAGKDKVDFVTKMLAFKSGERAATVMHHHAKGLNSQEIADLADYFSAQTPHKSASLVPQKLSETLPN
jgi:cytochrome c553